MLNMHSTDSTGETTTTGLDLRNKSTDGVKDKILNAIIQCSERADDEETLEFIKIQPAVADSYWKQSRDI